jgi:hypothetical protein
VPTAARTLSRSHANAGSTDTPQTLTAIDDNRGSARPDATGGLRSGRAEPKTR